MEMFLLNHLRPPTLRVTSLLSHFLLTTGLYWTKFDSIQVSMYDYTSDHEYKIMNQQYTGLISFGIILLIFQTLVLLFNPDEINLGTMLHLGADLSACFWISWIILDGLDWKTYVYIFVFCVVAPAIFDLFRVFQYLVQKRQVGWKKQAGLSDHLAEISFTLTKMWRRLIRR